MNRNIKNQISDLVQFISQLNNSSEIINLIIEMLTDAEVETLSKRWRILKMLHEGRTQRDISYELKVSLCKVTRGSKILKNKNSIIAKYFDKGD